MKSCFFLVSGNHRQRKPSCWDGHAYVWHDNLLVSLLLLWYIFADFGEFSFHYLASENSAAISYFLCYFVVSQSSRKYLLFWLVQLSGKREKDDTFYIDAITENCRFDSRKVCAVIVDQFCRSYEIILFIHRTSQSDASTIDLIVRW